MGGIKMTWEEYEALCKKMKKPVPVKSVKVDLPPEKGPKMSKTEMEYERTYLRDDPHMFEGISLRMSNGHRYTPDFFVYGDGCGDGRPQCHEVKGSYKLQSYGRAKLAFDQCQKEFPMFKFIWATKTKDGWVIR